MNITSSNAKSLRVLFPSVEFTSTSNNYANIMINALVDSNHVNENVIIRFVIDKSSVGDTTGMSPIEVNVRIDDKNN